MATPVQDRQQIDSSINYDFNYAEPPPDRLTCKICQLPCREAQKSECCGHVFCKRDLEKMKAATAVSYACPICRTEPFKTYPDRAVDREIKELRIYCRNKQIGCGCNWSGTLDQIDAHLNKCEVACEHCKEVMHYTAMISHVNECPCHCQYCGVVAERDVISGQHMEKCNKFSVPCPNTCGRDNIPQDEMDSHKKECPLEMVWCEYYDVGCKTMLVREKMPAHYRDEMAKHLQYMHRVVRELQKGKENLDNAEVVAKANLHENAEQIKELSNNHTHQEETIAKLREDIVGINEKSHYEGRFTVSIHHYEDHEGRFTSITEQLHNLSTSDNINLLRDHELVNLLKQTMKLLNGQEQQSTNAIVEIATNLVTLKEYLISVIHHLLSSLKPSAISRDIQLDILSELSGTILLVKPVFKLSDYKEKIKRKENWTSSPFFGFDEGYQMCLKVYPAGIGEGAGDHISVELYLMKGPNDDKLQKSGYWPLKGNFSVELLDQLRKGSKEDAHITRYRVANEFVKISRVNYDAVMIKIDDLSINMFASHTDLTVPYYFSKFVNSSVNGNLYFRVLYNDEDETSYSDISRLSSQLNVQKLSVNEALRVLTLKESDERDVNQVAPVVLYLMIFTQMINGEPWYSNPFFAFERGYKMCLKVKAVSNDHDPCLISVKLFLMKGPFDEELDRSGLWPLRGRFTVELLGDDNNYSRSLILNKDKCSKCVQRVMKNKRAQYGYGWSVFTRARDDLCTKQYNFVRHNSLFFRVSYSFSND